MSQYLADKVIIVTGAGSGFGRLIAQKCAAGGAKVVGVDVNADNLDEIISGITAAGGQGVAQVADVTDLAQLKAAAARAVDDLRRHRRAGEQCRRDAVGLLRRPRTAWQKWHQAIDINIKGVVNGISAVYDQMMAQGRGQVVNISSIYGNGGVEGAGVYSATKAAVTALSDALRVEAQGRIKVTTVKPTGVFGTNLASGIVNETAIMGLAGQKGCGVRREPRQLHDRRTAARADRRRLGAVLADHTRGSGGRGGARDRPAVGNQHQRCDGAGQRRELHPLRLE